MAFSWVILAMSVVGHVVRGELGGQLLGGCGPHRVRVRIVGLPGDVVDSDAVAHGDADRVTDEAGEEVLTEDLAREPAAEVLQRPGPVHVVGPVHPLEEVGDPAGAAFGERHAQVGKVLQDPGPQEIGRGGLDVHRLQRDHHVRR